MLLTSRLAGIMMDYEHACINIVWQQKKKERQLYLLNPDDVYIPVNVYDHKRTKKYNLLCSDQLRLRNPQDYAITMIIHHIYCSLPHINILVYYTD